MGSASAPPDTPLFDAIRPLEAPQNFPLGQMEHRRGTGMAGKAPACAYC